MTNSDRVVYGGVDTHKDVHVAAVVDQTGRVLDTRPFPTGPAGYHHLAGWLREAGVVAKVGIEGTGSYGAGLTRHLASAGIEVIEVNRPNRQLRRRRGKSDTVDAEAAARAALNGEASGAPKQTDGVVEAIRALRIVFCSTRNTRTRLANQIRDLVVTAPDELRDLLEPLVTDDRVERCARFRVTGELSDPTSATKTALRTLARQHQTLGVDLARLRGELDTLTMQANPALRAAPGVGPDVASILLITAGQNADRLMSDAAFAALCGASPIEASSGKHTAHRLNRGGNRSANHALWRIATIRLSCHEPTIAYAQRRRAEGKTPRAIVRCLKRYIAREIYQHLTNPQPVATIDDLRASRHAAGIALTTAAAALGTQHSRLSELERGLLHRPELAQRYRTWLAEQAT